jgi:hypothetical protein
VIFLQESRALEKEGDRVDLAAESIIASLKIRRAAGFALTARPSDVLGWSRRGVPGLLCDDADE